MGGCNFKTDIQLPPYSISKAAFQQHYVIGKGGFGKVWKLEHKHSGELFAMKEMSKARILAKKSVPSVMSERQLLAILHHSFIVNMHYAFQDRENLYLVMDLMPGGDLRYHLGKVKKFSEEQTSDCHIEFFLACVLTGLEYLHGHSVLHRDIKPENLVLDGRGYVRITDMGIARVLQAENAKDTSGTPGYMAPEVMFKQNHGLEVDFFAIGVIAFEFMTGKRPYAGKNRKDIRDQVMARQAQLQEGDLPEGWSIDAMDFINRLILRKSSARLGSRGIDEVKRHPWFAHFPWEKLNLKALPSPFVPGEGGDHFDIRLNLSNDPWKDAHSPAMREATIILKKPETQQFFHGYYYDATHSIKTE